MLKISGNLKVYKTFVNKPSQVLFNESNLIVDGGLEALAALLAGAEDQPSVANTTFAPSSPNPPTELFVEKLAVTEQSSPNDPQSGDTSLQGTISKEWLASNDTLTVTYPQPGQVKFSGALAPSEKAGSVFTEEGLITKGGQLIARTLFAKPATGTITFANGMNVTSGNSVFLHDGSQGQTFTFGSSGNVTVGSNPTKSRDNLITAINGSALTITASVATANVPKINLVNDQRRPQGNQNISTVGSVLVATGMSGGSTAIEKQSSFGLQFDHTFTISR